MLSFSYFYTLKSYCFGLKRKEITHQLVDCPREDFDPCGFQIDDNYGNIQHVATTHVSLVI